MLRFVVAALVGLSLAVMANAPARATPFLFEYNDTVVFSSVAGVTAGDAAKITVTLDNGNATNISQTWTSADLLSVAFNFNNGALVTTFSSPFDGGLTGGAGDFMTNAAGVLTSVLTSWFDSDVTADFATTSSATEFDWFLNGANPVIFHDKSTEISLTAVIDILNPAAWSQVSSTDVPEPATLTLFGFGLAGLGFVLRRRRKPQPALR